MSKWNASQEDKEAAAGALMILGSMLYEWGLPLDRALAGLRRAYEMESAKHVHACTCRDDRDKDLCKNKEHCVQVMTFAASIDAKPAPVTEEKAIGWIPVSERFPAKND